MRDEGHTGRDQHRTRGVDHHGARTVDALEGHLVIRTRSLAIFEFGLGHGGLEVDVPQRGRFLGVGLAPSEVPQERLLAHAPTALVDRGVQVRPIDRQTETPEEIFEDLLVLVREFLAQLDEVRTRNGDRLVVLGRVATEGRLEPGLIRDARVAANAEEVLDATLGGQTVVVPAHRIEDRLAAHAVEAGEGVGVRVGEHVAHVERATHRGRRGVDRVHSRTRRRIIEAIGAGGLPGLDPLTLDAFE